MLSTVPDLLTVVITTSPTPSAPSTELLSSVLQSLYQNCPDLLTCRVIIVFDTYDHIRDKGQLKKGQVTEKVAKDYDEYKLKVKQLILLEYAQCEQQIFFNTSHEAEYGSPNCAENHVHYEVAQTPDAKITFIEPAQRLGFSLAVRSALRAVTTPYVWVHQHDWTLVTDIPIRSFLEVMQAADSSEDAPVKYICLPAIRMLSYAVQSDVQRFPALKSCTDSLRRSFSLASEPGQGLPLTPLFFWHDKPHIASTAHYLARVFPSRLAVRRGEFIEDTIGQKARKQMKEGQWHKWACWLYYPGDGKQLCLKHLDGRVWRGVEGEMKQKMIWKTLKQVDGTTNSRATTIHSTTIDPKLDNLFV